MTNPQSELIAEAINMFFKDEEHDLLVSEEIRWETRGEGGNSGACNCQPGGDGPPCPHGNFDIQYKCRVTEAAIAKKLLEDWEYDDEEDEEEDWEDEDEQGDEDYVVDMPPEIRTADDGVDPLEGEETNALNTNAPTYIPPSASEGDESEEDWFYNEVTGEWEVS